jgi:hypothetical protein
MLLILRVPSRSCYGCRNLFTLVLFFKQVVIALSVFLLTRICVQVFTYVSQKMLSEGSEKSWDQCRVKLKNLKSQWRYVRDRVPGIEEADMEDENVVRQVMTDCQNRGVSPTCVKHLRYVP